MQVLSLIQPSLQLPQLPSAAFGLKSGQPLGRVTPGLPAFWVRCSMCGSLSFSLQPPFDLVDSCVCPMSYRGKGLLQALK